MITIDQLKNSKVVYNVQAFNVFECVVLKLISEHKQDYNIWYDEDSIVVEFKVSLDGDSHDIIRELTNESLERYYLTKHEAVDALVKDELCYL